MDKVAFEDQKPGDVKYGSFTVDELEAMGFAPMHSHVQGLQDLSKAKKSLRAYAVGLNNYAAEILRHRTAYTEYEISTCAVMNRAADLIRELDGSLGFSQTGGKFLTREQVIDQLNAYIVFLQDYPDTLVPDKANSLAMVVRLLQDK